MRLPTVVFNVTGVVGGMVVNVVDVRTVVGMGEQAPRGVGDISEAAVINLSTMTRIVQRMAGKKLVRCTPRSADYRITAAANLVRRLWLETQEQVSVLDG